MTGKTGAQAWDLDAIAPVHAPGVGSPEPDRSNGRHVIDQLAPILLDRRLPALDMAKSIPGHDRNQTTLRLIAEAITKLVKCSPAGG